VQPQPRFGAAVMRAAELLAALAHHVRLDFVRNLRRRISMASSESQGKTIALVFFVVTTVTGAAFAYHFFNKVDSAESSAAKAAQDKRETETKLAAKSTEYKELAEFVRGVSGAGDDHAKVVELVRDKLKNPNANSPRKSGGPARKATHETLGGALDYLNALIAGLDKELVAQDTDKDQLTNRLAQAQKINEAKISEVNTNLKDKVAEGAKSSAEFQDQLSRAEQSVALFQKRYSEKQTEAEEYKRTSSAKIGELEGKIVYNQLILERVRARERSKENNKFDLEDGEIVQTQSGGQQAYLNIGRLDGVIEGLTFGVYGRDSSGFIQALPKANLEIIQILGDGRSLARVFDYDISNPVQGGDKIFNPVWDRGKKLGIAVVGVVDLDMDGRPDNEEFYKLIEQFGGRVDAKVDFKTFRPVGRITVDTAFLVEGKMLEPADEKVYETEDAKKLREVLLKANGRFIGEAKDAGVRRVNVQNFLAFMGYRGVRKLEKAGEEDLRRQINRDQGTKRLQPNPDDRIEAGDAELMKDKPGKKPAAKPSGSTKKKSDDEEGDAGTKPEKKDEGKKKKKQDDDL
jgi:hypothetical protein